MQPTLDEIEATVARLEQKLLTALTPDVARLLAGYRLADARFRADLTDPRDMALSRGAALMLIKIVSERTDTA